MMLKITEIKIKDKNTSKIKDFPDYECDIVVKYHTEDGEHHHNQIEVRSLKFDSDLLNKIANELLEEFKSKMAE